MAKKKYKFSNRSLKEISKIWPDGRRILFLAMSYQHMDFGLIEGGGGRTKEFQKKLYAQGRTEPGNIVTWTLDSSHIIDESSGYGFAFDVVPFVNGSFSWDEKHCLELATLIFKAAIDLKVPIEWGYHLWGKDMPHFQCPERYR